MRKEDHSHWAVRLGGGLRHSRFQAQAGLRKHSDITMSLPAGWPTTPSWTNSDYSNREHEATLENIGDAAWRLRDEYDLPEDWQSAVLSWLWDNNDSAVENVDDQGGCPDEEQLRAAFDALGYKQLEAV